MSRARQQQEDREHEPLMSGASEKKRFPQVFKWKVATIVISVLITIFLITDIILLVNYNNNQPRNNNYTFLSDILSQTNNQQITRQNFVNMAKGLTQSYSDLWFQTATQIYSWTGPILNLDAVGNLFDGQADQLFLVTLSDGANSYLAAAYSHIAFSLPSGWQDYLNNTVVRTHYYTFQITDRQSTIVGGGSPSYLRMSGSTANLLNCLVIDLDKNSLAYLNMLSINFATAQLNIANTYPECFQGEPDAPTVLANLQSILGLTAIPPTLNVVSIEAYDLSA